MRKRLGDILVEWGAISHTDLDAALQTQKREPAATRRRLGRILLEEERVSEATLAAALAEVHGIPSVDLNFEGVDPDVARSIPKNLAMRTLVLPVSVKDGVLRVAVADPVDVVALDDVRLHLRGLSLQVVVAPESQIKKRLQMVWSEATAQEALVESEPSAAEIDEQDISSAAGDVGAVAAVHQILDTAARMGASDVHVEPLRTSVRVRMRTDGTLREVMNLPKSGQNSIIARIKVVSGLDISERRVPQDGRTRVRVEGLERNIRVSTLPTIYGEKIVLRMLPDVEELPTLASLGMPEQQVRLIRSAIRMPQGMILVTGPTGAGKSTTLYSAIREVVTGDRNLIALEDPVEIELPGVTQVQVNERTGMTFPAGLRSALRQDPDVIMIGEIRDATTAEMAVRASLTGHLVLSTLHTLSAAAAITRLMDMGVPPYLVASSLSLTMAQRLVRKPCPRCVVSSIPDPDTRQRLGISPQQARGFVVGTGCDFCDHSGYRGRTGVYEVLPITDKVRGGLLRGDDVEEVAEFARPFGWRSLLEEGVAMGAAGQTTAAELLRVLVTTTMLEEELPEAAAKS